MFCPPDVLRILFLVNCSVAGTALLVIAHGYFQADCLPTDGYWPEVGGLEASAKISLMAEVLPQKVWQSESFRSRKEAAKACMAACVGMALHIVDQGGDQTLTKNGWGLANILSTTTIENIDFSFVERGF